MDGEKNIPVKVENSRCPEFVGHLLHRAARLVYSDFDRIFEGIEITPTQFATLMVIEQNPGMKQSEVGDAVAIKKNNFVALVGELEERGLIARTIPRNDRRAYALFLTAHGNRFLEDLKERYLTHEQTLLSALGEDECGTLVELLHRLTGNLPRA